MHPRIVVDPQICHGNPVIRGTRVLVRNILGSLESGEPPQSILKDYPSLHEEDIHAILQYASDLRSIGKDPYE